MSYIIDFTTFPAPFIGTISGSTLSTTGNKAITGVGFKPRLVTFQLVASNTSNNTSNDASGAMTSSSQFYSTVGGGGSVASRYGGTDAAIGWIGAGQGSLALKASYVSMDSDGFTINVTSAASTFPIAYIAYP